MIRLLLPMKSITRRKITKLEGFQSGVVLMIRMSDSRSHERWTIWKSVSTPANLLSLVEVKLVGMVLNKAERVTDISFVLDDGTGRIDRNGQYASYLVFIFLPGIRGRRVCSSSWPTKRLSWEKHFVVFGITASLSSLDGQTLLANEEYHKVNDNEAGALCVTIVKDEDYMEFNRILEAIKANLNDKYDEYKEKWGRGILDINISKNTI